MKRSLARNKAKHQAGAPARGMRAPLVWTFDGAFATCLFDIEDTVRRAIVQVGDVSRIALLIELSLPALRTRVNGVPGSTGALRISLLSRILLGGLSWTFGFEERVCRWLQREL